MVKFVLAVLSVLAVSMTFGTEWDDGKEKECMAWALNRIVGVPFRERKSELSTTVAPAKNATGKATSKPMIDQAFGPFEPVLGRGKPGKQGATGPPGERGPPGAPGICDCVPDEVIELQKENADLKEKLERIRLTSPQTYCLLGMKARTIKDEQINVSSNPNVKGNGRLDGTVNGWYPSAYNAGQEWIMVDLGKVRNVTGVVTQGRYDYDSWVLTYQVEHSVNGVNFTDVLKEDGSEMVFTGNSDRHTKKVNRFPEAVGTRFVRIYPMTYKHSMFMRIDLIDC